MEYMKDLDKLYDAVKENISKGNTFQVDEENPLGNLDLVDKTSLIRLKDYTVKLEETYEKDTKEVRRVIAIFVKNNTLNNNRDIIDFNNNYWYNDYKKIGEVLIVDVDFYANEFDVSVGKSFGNGVVNSADFYSLDENNASFYSTKLLKELKVLEEEFVGSNDEFKKEIELIDQKAKVIPNEKIIEAVKNLNLEALKTGDFEQKLTEEKQEHKYITVKLEDLNEQESPFIEEEPVKETPVEKKDEEHYESLDNLTIERIKELTEELKREKDQESLETPKHSESTMMRFGLYVKFLLQHGARKDIVELPAIQNIILNVIENGDPRVLAEGKSPISYREPNEDGTFNIYGKMEGYTSSVVYEMDLDEQEEKGYYICLTKKDIRDYLLFNEDNRKPEEKIYIDKEGKLIDNLNEKTK